MKDNDDNKDAFEKVRKLQKLGDPVPHKEEFLAKGGNPLDIVKDMKAEIDPKTGIDHARYFGGLTAQEARARQERNTTKRGPSLKKSMQHYLNDNHKVNFAKLVDKQMKLALDGDIKAQEFLLKETGLIRQEDIIHMSGEDGESLPVFTIIGYTPPGSESKEEEQNDVIDESKD